MTTIPRKFNTAKNLAIIAGSSPNEPIVTENNYNEDISAALNWYGNHDINKIRKYAIQYTTITEREECLYALEKATDAEIKYIGTLGRLLLRNQYVSENHIQLTIDSLNNLYNKYQKPVTVKEKVVAEPIDKSKEIVNKYGAEIDSEIDYFIVNKNSTFSTKAFLEQNNINSIIAKKIGALYTGTLVELELCDTDAELRSGYSNFSNSQLKKFREFIRGIINNCNQHSESTKVKRTVRVVKPKSPVVITAKVQYLREFPELELKSIPVIKLVDTTEVWLYNTVNRKITVYYGADGGNMTVKGTTLINYDILKSVTKTLRKPEESFKALLNYNKRTLNNWFKSITTKSIVVSTGRLNADSIIIAAF